MAEDTKSVLSKVSALLGVFEKSPNAAFGLSELSRGSRVSKASAFRLIQQLVEFGWVERDASGYRLGWRSFNLGLCVPDMSQLRRVAVPVLADLWASTRGVIHLATFEETECIYVERVAGRWDGSALPVGDRCPIWYAAAGKLFIAASENGQELAKRLDAGSTRPLTRFSVHSTKELDRQLVGVRERGWAMEDQECIEHHWSIACGVALPGYRGIDFAVSATLPTSQRGRQVPLIRAVQQAAGTISRTLRIQQQEQRRHEFGGLTHSTQITSAHGWQLQKESR